MLGHWLFGAPFTATSMIGFIALAGIIVRNSILLVDFIRHADARRTGRCATSLLEAGAIRFKPILLTALAAMIGAAVILTDPIFQGLAISLLFGLASSTLLTVLVIPAIYIALRDDQVPLTNQWKGNDMTTSPPAPQIRAFFDQPTNTISYLVADPVTRRAAVIDPVLDFDQRDGTVDVRSVEAILTAASEEKLTIEWVLETHAHADHLSGAPYIKSKTGARIGIGEHIKDVQRIFRPVFNAQDLRTDGSDFDRLFADGETFNIGELVVEVLHTPGHTPADLSYRIGDAVFVGDTLFMPDYGTARADFPGGDAHQLYRSIQRLLAAARRNAAVHVPRLQGARPRRLRLGNHGARAAREQRPPSRRRHRGCVRGHAAGARRDVVRADAAACLQSR